MATTLAKQEKHRLGSRRSVIKSASKDGPGSKSLTHIPYCILTSADIKLGYFDSSVVPSSNETKENVGGTQPGSLARKSEYISPMSFRRCRNDRLSSNGRLAMRTSKTASDFFQESYPSDPI